ncbi:winged helix-turn-helix domain-containing protein [Amylibacter sp.]|nr:winged helix-turn-helix domain-containing protein [Amylibacter sp.]
MIELFTNIISLKIAFVIAIALCPLVIFLTFAVLHREQKFWLYAFFGMATNLLGLSILIANNLISLEMAVTSAAILRLVSIYFCFLVILYFSEKPKHGFFPKIILLTVLFLIINNYFNFSSYTVTILIVCLIRFLIATAIIILISRNFGKLSRLGDIFFVLFSVGIMVTSILISWTLIYGPKSHDLQEIVTDIFSLGPLVFGFTNVFFVTMATILNGFSYSAIKRSGQIIDKAKVWSLQRANHTLTTPDGRIFVMSSSEFKVMELLIQGGVNGVSKEDLTHAAIGSMDVNHVYSRALEVMISRLRSRVKLNGKTFPIKSVRNKGYIFHGIGSIDT